MSAENPVTEADWDEWHRRQAHDKLTVAGGPLLKAELAAAQTSVRETLRRVIHDGETIVINDDDGQPAAVILPYQQWLIRDLTKESNP